MECKVTVRKSHYPKEVPFEVPAGWVWCRVDDIGDVVTGMTPSKSVANYYGNDYPFYKPTDLEQGINTITSSDALSPEGYKDSRQIPCNSILVTCIGATIGKTGIIRREGSCNQQINAIIPHNVIVPEYLFSCCISDYFQDEIHHRASATTLPILNKFKFSEIPIPVPPINEQHRILEQLSHYIDYITSIEEQDSAIERNVQRCKNKILDLAIHGKLVPQDSTDEPAIEFLKRINPAFQPSDNLHYEGKLPNGWTVASVESFCTTTNGLWKGDKEPLINVGVIRNANFTKDFSLDYSKIEHINVEERSFSKRNLEDGDIIVEKSGGSDNFPVGRSILYRGESGKYSFSNFTMSLRIRDKKHIIPEYLFYVLQSMYRRGDMRQMQTQTTGLHNLLTDVFMSAQIPIPPSNEQKRIVTAIENHFQTLDRVRSLLQD